MFLRSSYFFQDLSLDVLQNEVLKQKMRVIVKRKRWRGISLGHEYREGHGGGKARKWGRSVLDRY